MPKILTKYYFENFVQNIDNPSFFTHSVDILNGTIRKQDI